MIKCQVCGYDNQDGAQFCLNCGSPLEQQKMSEAMDDISGEATVVIDPKALRIPQAPPPPAAAPKPAGAPPAPLPPPRPSGAAPVPPPAAPRPAAPPPPPPQAAAPPMGAPPQYGQPQQMSAAPPPPPPSQFGGGMQGIGNFGAPPPGELPNPWLYIGLSVATIFLCCCIGGIAATVVSYQGMKAAEAGDYETAMEKYKQARILMIISAVLGLLVGVVQVISLMTR